MHVQKAHSDDITGLRFSSDGRHLLSRSFDGTLKVTSFFIFYFILFYFFPIIFSCLQVQFVLSSYIFKIHNTSGLGLASNEAAS